MLALVRRYGKDAWVGILKDRIRFHRLARFTAKVLPFGGFVLPPFTEDTGYSFADRSRLMRTPRSATRIPITVVVNTLDRADLLRRLLTSLERLRYRPFEVVVVEGPCRDHTSAVLDGWQGRIRRLKCPERNLSMSRNIGLVAAAGEVVAFIDDDAVPEPDWLDHLAEAMSRPDVGAAGGPIRDHTGVQYQARALTVDHMGLARDVDMSGVEIDGGEAGDHRLSLTGTNFCLRRSAALAVGGFDEYFNYYLEETDIQRRLVDAGFRLAFVPEAEVHHGFAANSIRDADKIPTDFEVVTRSLVYFCRKHARGEGERELAGVTKRIARHLDKIHRRITRLSQRGVIEAETAHRLWRSALKGVRSAGRTEQRTGTSALLAKATRPNVFHPFPGAAAKGRVALVAALLGETGAAAALAADLAKKGLEVSFVSAGARRHCVEFRDGYWHHEVPRDRKVDPARQLEQVVPAEELLRELRRVEERRRFAHVVCVSHRSDLDDYEIRIYETGESGEIRCVGADVVDRFTVATEDDLARSAKLVLSALREDAGIAPAADVEDDVKIQIGEA